MNVWYEKMSHPPQHGTLLESVFQYLWKLRQKVEYLKLAYTVKAIIGAPLQTVEGANLDNEGIESAHAELFDSMFPYHEKEKQRETADASETLTSWVDSVDAIQVTETLPDIKTVIRDHRRAKDERASRAAQGRRFSNVIQRLA